jgi:hypothetical protein
MKKLTLSQAESFLRIVFILLAVASIVQNILVRNWNVTLRATSTLNLLLILTFFHKLTRIVIPVTLKLTIGLFIFASMYLGAVHFFMNRFFWWDDMLHIISAAVVGLMGYLLIHSLNRDLQIESKLSPFFIALFVFSFSAMVHVIWEIFEYAMDSWAGQNMQRAKDLLLPDGSYNSRLGLMDTMTDLLVDMAGAFFAGVFSYVYSVKLRKGDKVRWDMKDTFLKDNQHLFAPAVDKNHSTEDKS